MKTCSICGTLKPLDDFHRETRRKDGRRSDCKECVKKSKDARKDKINARRREYYSENTERILNRNKNWRKKNHDKIKSYQENNQEKRNAQALEYHFNNRDSILKRQKEYRLNSHYEIRKRELKYCRDNKAKRHAIWKKRQAAKLKRTPGWLTKEQLKSIEGFYIAARIMEEVTGKRFHVDHIVPLQGQTVSGLHVPWNLQILTAEENQHKSNRFNGRVAA